MSVSIRELNSTSINLFRGFFTDDILPHSSSRQSTRDDNVPPIVIMISTTYHSLT